MKRTVIIFLILLIVTLLIPLAAVIKTEKSDANDELVTLFSSQVTVCDSANTPLCGTFPAID